MLMRLEGTAATIANASIKREMTGETKSKENKTEPHQTPNHSTKKRPPYADKEGKEDETGGKIKPIRQKTQAEEAATRDDKTCRNNYQKKSIIVTGNIKWCSHEKISNKQNSIVKKKDEYNDIKNKYLKKIDDHRKKLLILLEEAIKNYRAFKKSYTNENNALTVLDTSPEENIQDPEENI